MDSPFVFGRLATDQAFTNRTEEIKQLSGNFQHGINTTLISPRRWGKSSLVQKCSREFIKKNKNVRVVHLDLFSIRSENAFYQTFSEAVIKVTSSKVEEITQNIRKLLGHLAPKISLSTDPTQSFGIEFEVKSLRQNAQSILDLPQKIAEEKGIRIIVCIDEFQNISHFDDPLAFQKLLRSVWQLQQQTTYCLYGSKRHMLTEMFNNPSMPFYRFGDVVLLDKISLDHWIDFIQKAFSTSGKKISKAFSSNIAEWMQCHPYYVQQLAHRVWIRTERETTPEILQQALSALLEQNTFLFEREIDQLTTTQINFLKALLDQVTQFSSAQNIKQYAFGTSANVLKIKSALEKTEIIDLAPDNKVSFMDPAFEMWLRKYYFKM